MLSVEKIKKSYGEKKVLRDVSFTVQEGKICGLLGLNGAGKSTLMKILCQLAFADGGNAYLNGQSLLQNNSGIGFMIESPAFYRELTGRQNLAALAELYPDIPEERVDEVLRLVGIEHQADTLVKKYSLGMKQRLYFAYSLLSRPKLLILDEPFNGIDPVSIKLFKEVITGLAEEGCTILISGHVISELSKLCDSVCIIDCGSVVFTSEDAKALDLEEVFLSHVSDSGDAQ